MKLYGWVEHVRDRGSIKFITLRIDGSRYPVVYKGAEKVKREEAIEVVGEWRERPDGKGNEFAAQSLKVVGRVYDRLPVDPTGQVPSSLDTRLDYRFLDMRNDRVRKIFTTRSALVNAFRRSVIKKGFVEIHPPSIVAAATEGGAELFEVKYFERKAYLAQSPQLYKQMAVVGGLTKVFMTVPVFRAEKHDTAYHLNESWQMDVEMGFATDEDAIRLAGEVMGDILEEVSGERPEMKVITFSQAMDILGKEDNDLNREDERALYHELGELVMVKDWPRESRPFYTMPNPDGNTCKGYDLIYKGLEILSGAQRVHVPEILIQELEWRGLNPKNFEFYINAFRFGAPPHAGWSIGLDRLTMQMLDLPNIREAVLFPRDRKRLTP